MELSKTRPNIRDAHYLTLELNVVKMIKWVAKFNAYDYADY